MMQTMTKSFNIVLTMKLGKSGGTVSKESQWYSVADPWGEHEGENPGSAPGIKREVYI